MTSARNVNSIEDLVGEPVDSICFPADYVELRFVGPILRLLLFPVRVERRERLAEFPKDGSRDLLCSLVGSCISDVLLTDTQLTLSFSDGARLVARIDESDPRGPESIHFVPWENGRLNVASMEIL